MTWIAPTPDPVDGPLTGADRPILEGFLAWERATLLNICAGLNGDQLASRPLPASNLSLLDQTGPAQIGRSEIGILEVSSDQVGTSALRLGTLPASSYEVARTEQKRTDATAVAVQVDVDQRLRAAVGQVRGLGQRDPEFLVDWAG